mmetsp:Transcript_881/g.3287  ORF Transcript_881/g.3287 Transcript_881/m.3287 type:complete len:212 (+) Transcript_881:1680-2315(+)
MARSFLVVMTPMKSTMFGCLSLRMMDTSPRNSSLDSSVMSWSISFFTATSVLRHIPRYTSPKDPIPTLSPNVTSSTLMFHWLSSPATPTDSLIASMLSWVSLSDLLGLAPMTMASSPPSPLRTGRVLVPASIRSPWPWLLPPAPADVGLPSLLPPPLPLLRLFLFRSSSRASSRLWELWPPVLSPAPPSPSSLEPSFMLLVRIRDSIVDTS